MPLPLSTCLPPLSPLARGLGRVSPPDSQGSRDGCRQTHWDALSLDWHLCLSGAWLPPGPSGQRVSLK